MEVETMNQYVTGAVIKEMREQKKMTQLQLAELLGVTDKTVSKWETGKGYPDITLLEPIADAFRISVTELISGNQIKNENVSANMMRSKFYVCPVCGNAIHSMGEAVIQCHGVQLLPAEAEQTDENHMIFIERVEDEYYVRIDHEMTKEHYISFIAASSPDRIQMVKLYPEGNAEARFKISGVRKIFFYCNRDGLFSIDVVKGIDDKETSYDDTKERMELEKTADMLFGKISGK
jgi:transcriptional regulator with XRE-family HTH domain